MTHDNALAYSIQIRHIPAGYVMQAGVRNDNGTGYTGAKRVL